MKRQTLLSVAGGFCAVLSASSDTLTNRQVVIAAEVKERETGSERDHMTGDWGGIRTRMVNHGVHLQAGYIGEVLGNLSGGSRRGAVYGGLLELGLRLETKEAGLWEGGTLQISSLVPHGRGFSENYLGNLLTVSNIEAYESWRLYDLWYEQQIGDQFSIRLGQLTAEEEFAYTEPGGEFVNSAFGWPAFISGNTVNTGPAYFVAVPGIRFNYEPNESLFVRVGVFDGDSFDSEEGDPGVNANGTHFHVSRAQGFFGIAEAGLRLNQSEGAQGLPGEYKIGVWGHSGDFRSNFEDAEGEPFVVTGEEPRTYSKNFGVYFAMQQMLWEEEGAQGLYTFARIGGSPRDRSFFELSTDGGITYRGLVPGREEDTAGLGGVYARISRDIRKTERLVAALSGTTGHSDYEAVFEAFYTIQFTKWWSLQPDFQWIINPGGNTAAKDALVLGLRTALVF